MRAEFLLGDPEGLSAALIEEAVRNLKAEHEVWIAVFNPTNFDDEIDMLSNNPRQATHCLSRRSYSSHHGHIAGL